MSRQFTIEQVIAHNNKNNPPKNWYVVIHGEVYRVGSIPFKKCPISAEMVIAKLVSDPDASDLFVTEHLDGTTVEVLKSARRCHVGTIVKAPAGGQQGQPAHHAQQGQPGQQEENANHGQHGQNDGHVQNEQNRQPNDDDDDDGWTVAERRRREEARKRRLRKAYNPLKQDPDDADEYPADAVAMGYLPDLDGRRWRERRMRLSRFIQYNDSPAVEEEELDPIARSLLDMDFAKEIWYKRNLKGGEARGCTGSFQAARPPPPRSQLRPRPGAPDPSGHHHHQQPPPPPPPRDLPDSDADDDDDDEDAPGAPALRAQVQVEARVREWFPSNSNRTVHHLATPPVTPQTHPAQQTVRPPIQPPAPPPQHPQQRSREEEEEISKQRKAKELADAEEVIRKQQKNQAVVNETMDRNFPIKDKPAATETGPKTPQNTQQSIVSGAKTVTKVRDEERAKQSRQRRDAARKKKQEERRKQKEDDELKRQKAQAEAQKKQEEDAKKKQEEDAKKKQEEDAKKKQKEEEDKLKRQKEQEEAQKKNAAKRADKEPPKKLEGQELEDARKQTQKMMREKADQANRENQEKKARELQEGKDSQAAIEKQYRTAQQELFTAQQARIQDYMNKGIYDLRQATNVVLGFQGYLVEDPNKKVRKSPWPALPKWSPIKFMDPLELTSPKRPAETTQEDQGSNKKPRKDETQQNKKGQAGGSSSSSSKFSDKNRPWKKGEEPWAKPQGAGQKLGSGAEGLIDDDDDWDDSADELAAPGVTTGTGASTGGSGGGGGAAQTPRRNVLDLPPNAPPRGNTTTGASSTPQNVPAQSQGYGTVPPAAGWPTTGTTPPTPTPAPKTTRSSRSGRRRGPGLAPGAQIPDDIKKLMREHARKK